MDSRIRPILAVSLFVLACGAVACDSPSGPSVAPLPLQRETATMQYYYAAGDTIDVAWQETYNAWALGRLGVTPPQRVEYYKYRSRDDMGRHIGVSSTNGYSEPDKFRVHSIWPQDNHEVVHVYSAMIGRPSDFFNEGLAVSFQTNPAGQDFTVRFNGMQVHEACRGYLSGGTLPRPLASYVSTVGFRSIQDTTMSYRMAGSFVLYLTERFGLPAVLDFIRGGGGATESSATIQTRLRAVFGLSVEELEADWLAMVSR